MQSNWDVNVQKIDPKTRRDKIEYYFVVSCGITITLLFASWWFSLQHVSNNFHGVAHFFDYVLFGILSFVVWFQMINELFFWNYVGSIRVPKYIEPQPGLKIAFLTAFVPQKEPIEILSNTLSAMVEAEYSHDTWLLDEGNSEQVKRLCQRLGVKHFSRKNIEKYNQTSGKFKAKTKAGNYNSWYDTNSSNYDIVAQLDVDFVPKKNFLTKTLGFFRDPSIAFVGTPQIYGNQSESWIARGAAEQSFNFHGPMQKGLFGKDMPLLIGSNHVIRVKAHDDIGGYAGHIVEDHLTGIKVYAKRWKSIYVPEILAVGEGPANWDSYFSQQMRWAYGLFHILFTQTPKYLSRMKRIHGINYLWLQHYYFYGLAQFLGIFLLLLYFLFGVQATSMKFIEMLVLFTALISVQLAISLLFQRYNIDRKNESGFLLRGRLLQIAAWPIYLLALSLIIRGKRLSYKTTPKGSARVIYSSNLSLFIPHIVMGSLTLIALIASIWTRHNAPNLIFWALLNTLVMYSFFAMELFKFLRGNKIDFRLQQQFAPIKAYYSDGFAPLTSGQLISKMRKLLLNTALLVIK
ncbi:glycosyltransferase [Candidatus Curtissbacteria bacterium]|nr:glycosyltransferase [Candidatus Curtissbacteria bacterium]